MKAYAIYGPPGTGKSHRLIDIATSLPTGTKYLCISHTRAAAGELVSRLKDPAKGSTLHSLCYHLTNASNSQVIDDKKLEDFTRLTGIRTTDDAIDEGTVPEGTEYRRVVEYAASTDRSMNECYDGFGRPGNPIRFKAFQVYYKQWKDNNGYADFYDMLTRYINNPRNPDLHTLLIDEAQDLSPLQWKVVEVMSQYLQEIYIAGDDDQAIYEWAGADPYGMPKFEELHGAERTILSQSFRVPVRAHVLAQSIIQRVQSRVPKSYLPTAETGRVLKYGNLEKINLDGRECVTILARDNYKLREISGELRSRRIPYDASGIRSILNNKYGKALRIFRKIQAGEEPIPKEIKTLRNGATPQAKSYIDQRDWKTLTKYGANNKWVRVINCHGYMFDELNNADFSTVPKIKLSTIHAAKGTEAENVIVYLARSQRIIRNEMFNPDPEHRLFYVAVTRTSKKLDIVDGDGGYRL